MAPRQAGVQTGWSGLFISEGRPEATPGETGLVGLYLDESALATMGSSSKGYAYAASSALGIGFNPQAIGGGPPRQAEIYSGFSPVYLAQSTSYETGLPGIIVDESAAVGAVFVIHPFV